MRAIWNFISSLKLTLWIMAGITAALFIGGIFCLVDFAFFNTMNGMPIQRWFLQHGLAHVGLTWWLPLIFLLFLILGVNLAACAADRIVQLLPKRKQMGPGAFFTALTPSLVHLAFLLVLGGHFITFTAGFQQRIPIVPGESAPLPDGGTVKFLDIETVMYPENTLLKGRMAQRTLLAEIDGSPARLAFAGYLTRGFFALHLDMNMREGRTPVIAPKMDPKETCNQSDLYKKKKQEAAGTPLFLQVTYDPGLNVILAGLSVIIVLMGWFFWNTYARRRARQSPANGDDHPGRGSGLP